MLFQFNAQNQKKFEELLSHYPTKVAALLPTLWLVQEQEGNISFEAMEVVANLLDVSPAHVYSVATFYTMYHLKPVGKHHLQVCRTLSCALMGSENLLEHFKNKLKINEGEVTPDGRFSLCAVECLASCGTAPAMMVNETYHENLNVQKVDQILKELK
ncbi:MAG: NADH-quinone oxidoreductase subunit E [Deltaproteobacteria bacterium RIFCSPLOWO2_12_FULL_40_28]|nr:MAG: NADH-quinone oxidoreductase subunit E [Deltaproteobacteria bacterium RIFCSPHIGHO2_02_FULL_40_28]OGQ19906.1 MAG: NADH-quinone oxidoreductase subunit E [Deltaproteobacteria bacterium RIFCSPHIGHO2_12_FULL_40_32]OGQ39665.1 MAG: NADH-quinone oxidoreductase subunit E [Deltaproteobacteria bacterium RIFCSPLOWO2_02_FULL_40_36]OGQ52921.1 MAG: NADH-quinone oxidoreductase subunit E [Deltaproteobacteria bacterium RIFCSPLOWO2_12_FULL_40_28]